MVRRLVEAGLATREPRGPIVVPFPTELFESWRLSPIRSAESQWFIDKSPKKIAEALTEATRGRVAFTGVFAAGVLTGLQDPERVEAYVLDRAAARKAARALGGEAAERGTNLSLLAPRDPAVLSLGSRKERGLPIVSISQAYRDALVRGRGRDLETAAQLRRQFLRW
jgi:hypothetical protein